MIIEVKNLRKSFGDKKILSGINIGIEKGSIFGILGKNGAGKTILMNHLIGLIKPDKGLIKFNNFDIEDNICQYKNKINFASGYQSLQLHASLIENLEIFAGLYGVKNINSEINRVLNLLEIDREAFGNKKLFKFSSGETSKAVLAKSLLNRPEVLFLDEPMVFLDPVYKEKLIKILKKINRNEKTTIVFTSHQMDEVFDLCSEVAVLKNGKISFLGRVKKKNELLKYY